MRRLRSTPPRPGTVMVETAVIMIPFMLFVFGLIEWGWFMMQQHLTINAAREGARMAVVNNNPDPGSNAKTEDDIKAWINSKLADAVQGVTIEIYACDVNGNRVNVSSDPQFDPNVEHYKNAGYGEYLAVEINATHEPMLPLVLGKGLPIHAKAVMRSEGD